MAILNNETSKTIEERQVLEVTYPSGRKEIGVVYGNDCLGLHINCLDNYKTTIGKIMIEEGSLQYEVLEDHPQVELFGMEYDFVQNHNEE